MTSFDVFQMLPDAVEQSAIVEMARVLKPGGWMLLHVAALEILHGKHSVLSEENAPLHAGAAARDRRAGAGFRDRSADVRSLQPAADHAAGPGVAPR